MKKTILATTLAASLAFTAQANTHNQEEAPKTQDTKTDLIGFGGGALTGAAVGGPLGAVVGGIVGLLIANDIQDERIKKYQLTALQRSDQDLKDQAEMLAALKQEMHMLQNEKIVQLVSFEESRPEGLYDKLNNFNTSIQFGTASADIDESYQKQLGSLADLLRQFPELTVSLEGYADQRGDNAYNQTLSQKRAKAVADFLIANNVKDSQIQYTGNGVATKRDMTTASREKLFFDRKVNIRLLAKDRMMTAAN